MINFEQRVEERIDRIDVSLARVEEGVKSVHVLLEKHDAKATAALIKADEAHRRINNMPLTLLAKVRTVALWVTAVGGAAFFLWEKLGK